MVPGPERRRKGEIPDMVSQWLHDDQRLEGIIYTPYFLAKQLKLSPGSVTAACKALVRDGVIKQHGASPFMVGRK